MIGYDHHFGRGREGNSSFLDKYSSLHNYSLKVVDAYKISGDIISSSLIRSLIKSGDILRSKELLGYNYSLRGTVIKGNSIGRELGFPTANIDVKSIEQSIHFFSFNASAIIGLHAASVQPFPIPIKSVERSKPE